MSILFNQLVINCSRVIVFSYANYFTATKHTLLFANNVMQYSYLLSCVNISMLQTIRFCLLIVNCSTVFFYNVLICPCCKHTLLYVYHKLQQGNLLLCANIKPLIAKRLSGAKTTLLQTIRCCMITVFDLITAHTPISAQSRNSVVFRLQPVYFFLYFFTKAYVVGTLLNCIDKSMQFKWVLTTYAFVKKVRKKSQSSLNKSFSDFFYSVSLVDRYIFYHKWVCPVSLENL